MAQMRKRRIWSDKDKCRIVARTCVPGLSVFQVARRYDVTANLVFKRVRDPRFCSTIETEPDDTQFLPVEVSVVGVIDVSSWPSSIRQRHGKLNESAE